jgi:hypothetical protein
VTRLTVVVEGQSEEWLVSRLLGPHLAGHGVFARALVVRTRMARARRPAHRGGGRWAHVRNDVRRVLQDKRGDLRVSTMVDLYGMPRDYPGFAAAQATHDRAERCRRVEAAMSDDVDDRRFLPYVQKHEFEALVLCGLGHLAAHFDGQRERAAVAGLVRSVAGTLPEDVNDGPVTAPSRRLQTALPTYSKLVHGPLVLEAVGLGAIRERCARFSEWVGRMERLGGGGDQQAA